MHVYLKVKIKSLTAEAQTIRKEERKVNINARARKRLSREILSGRFRITCPNGLGERGRVITEHEMIRIQKKLERSRNITNSIKSYDRMFGLHKHRINLRHEARSSFIAYGFLRGNDYKVIETTDKRVDWAEVERLVKKYSEDDPRVTLQKFAEWKDASGMVPKA